MAASVSDLTCVAGLAVQRLRTRRGLRVEFLRAHLCILVCLLNRVDTLAKRGGGEFYPLFFSNLEYFSEVQSYVT